METATQAPRSIKTLALTMTRQSMRLSPTSSRVITRLFILSEARAAAVTQRALQLPEDEVHALAHEIIADYSRRHKDIRRVLLEHFAEVKGHVPDPDALSEERKLLIGSFFTMEYAIESAALFNPSLVLAPDQSNLPPGHVRAVMSLRATGEGHLSSIEFRHMTIDDDGHVHVAPVSRFVARPKISKDKLYDKHLFRLKLRAMSSPAPLLEEEEVGTQWSEEMLDAVLNRLEDRFTFDELAQVTHAYQCEDHPHPEFRNRILQRMMVLARANYEMRFPPESDISERVVFPVSANETRGIEDARFVKFIEEDGRSCYLATYTAFDGLNVVTQLLETPDFLHFNVHTLNGRHSQTKGMAFFPRRIDGKYAMISRVDGVNLYLMYSDNIHFWDDAILLRGPEEPWEFMQIGNCGSPIETEAGWVVLTHGVGPMRRYCIGALLLDKDDPSKVIGSTVEPLLAPDEEEREGYVPNVVYSCGGLVHRDRLILPYAVSDFATRIATAPMADLLAVLTRERVR